MSYMSEVRTGTVLLVVKRSRLWPIRMWYGGNKDAVTMTRILTPGDHCGVIDVLKDDDMTSYAALVVCSEGIGCVMIHSDHFRHA